MTTYNATGLAMGTTYYYRVRATNAGGDSANTATASPRPLTAAVHSVPDGDFQRIRPATSSTPIVAAV